MIELLFVTCLNVSPNDCRERSMLFTDVTPMACMMGAQPELAKWANEHPNWNVGGWKCQQVQTAEIEV